MLHHWYLSHHFIVGIGITFRQLNDTIQDQNLAVILGHMDLNLLMLGGLFEDGRVGSDTEALVKTNIFFPFTDAVCCRGWGPGSVSCLAQEK